MFSKLMRNIDLEHFLKLNDLHLVLNTMQQISLSLLNAIPNDPNSIDTTANESFDIMVINDCYSPALSETRSEYENDHIFGKKFVFIASIKSSFQSQNLRTFQSLKE